MATFQDLANEIVIEIIQFCRPADQRGARINLDTLCNLRLVSQRLNSLVSTILFATLKLDFWHSDHCVRTPDHSRCDKVLIALATRSTTLFDHTRKLMMRTETLFREQEIDKSGIRQTKSYVKERIFDIISALKNLQSIQYFHNPRLIPKELAADIFNALASLPSFEHLDISLGHEPAGQEDISRTVVLQPLSNLTTFRGFWYQSKPSAFSLEIASLLARCPNMTELMLHQYNKKGCKLHDILQDIDKLETGWKLERLTLRRVVVTPADIKDHIRHFRNLSFLEISTNSNPEAPTTFGQICHILQENGTFLRGVSTDRPEDPLLLDYLSSYSGLRELSLRTVDNKQIKNKSAIREQIYTCILPNHLETIEHLQIQMSRPEIPKKEHLVELMRCRNLKSLHIHWTINLDGLRNVRKNGLDEYISSLNAQASFEMGLFD